MARGIMKNKYVWWALYGIAGYYAYQWWMNSQQGALPTPASVPEPTVSAFPYYP